jgi:hypothetical protein
MEKISILKSKWFKKEVDKLLSGGMSKADIARQLDVLPQYINSLISGTRNITDQFLDKFIETYSINQFDLLLNSESRREVLSDNEDHPNAYTSTIENKLLDLISQKDTIMREQAEEIGVLKQMIVQLKQESVGRVSDASSSTIADAI